MKPMLLPPHAGCLSVAPLWPQAVQRARIAVARRLTRSAPIGMTAAAKANGARCGQRSHHRLHVHGC